MTDKHISTRFDADLEEIRTRMLLMGGLVEEQLQRATGIYETGELASAEVVFSHEKEVNALELELDDRCTHIIARRQPTAQDLRLVMAVTKTITDLERIGDEATKIARTAEQLHSGHKMLPAGFSGIRTAAALAAEMLRDALNAFARIDVPAARSVIARDSALDDEFRRLFRELLTFMLEDPRTISSALDVIWIAKALERIGDHAKNIAQYVVFVAEGVDVRHRGLKEAVANAAGGASSSGGA